MSDAQVAGPAIRAMLEPAERAQFEVELQRTLAQVTRSFDAELLTTLLRQWWVMAGGDPAAAEESRRRDTRWREYEPPAWEAEIKGWTRHIPITGPAVFEHLDEPGRVAFEEAWNQAVIRAADTFDAEPLSATVLRYWGVAMRHINPEYEQRLEHEYAEFLARLAVEHEAKTAGSAPNQPPAE